MTCDEQQKQLALLASDDLDEVAALPLRRHLLFCATCRDRLAEYRDGLDWVRRSRLNTDAAGMSQELKRRLIPQVAKRPPLVKPWAVARRAFDQLAPLRHEHVVAACAVLLLLVGATGSLRRPLSRWNPWNDRAIAEIGPVALAQLNDHQHLHPHVSHVGDEEDLRDFGELDSGLLSDDHSGRAGSQADKLRIEMQTRDPNVRIIWFAQADVK
jgi:hypothetical protein